MRFSLMTGVGRIGSGLVLTTAALLVAGCSNAGRFPGPSWNLTGGQGSVPVPAKSVYSGTTERSSVPTGPPPPPVVYRGGRDPITGRAPAWGSTPHGIEKVPLAPTQDQRSAPASAPNYSPGAQPAYNPPHPMQPATAVQALPAAPARPGTIEVRPGQTLTMIAAEQRVSIASLMSANRLRDPYLIAGQTLVLPPR
jgi:LysM domain